MFEISRLRPTTIPSSDRHLSKETPSVTPMCVAVGLHWCGGVTVVGLILQYLTSTMLSGSLEGRGGKKTLSWEVPWCLSPGYRRFVVPDERWGCPAAKGGPLSITAEKSINTDSNMYSPIIWLLQRNMAFHRSAKTLNPPMVKVRSIDRLATAQYPVGFHQMTQTKDKLCRSWVLSEKFSVCLCVFVQKSACQTVRVVMVTGRGLEVTRCGETSVDPDDESPDAQ